ncbi:dsRBD fold-containing protein [Pseudonocardia halophobica]|uniref:dsRBD fold-containing protein n=1 Tax=Pseudonocardia halophobica TaxID=29401 RepID=UPI003D91B2B4
MTEPTGAHTLSDALSDALAATGRARTGIPQGKRWTVIVDLEAGSGVTRAVARLHDRVSDRLVGTGQARLAPPDADVPGLADELAAAQALADLARVMQQMAHNEVEGATDVRGHLTTPG